MSATNDLITELSDFAAIPGTPGKAARILVENYVGRFEGVDEVDPYESTLNHFLNIGQLATAHTKDGSLRPTKQIARGIKVLQYGLHELTRIDATEEMMEKLGKIARAMEDWCDVMERV